VNLLHPSLLLVLLCHRAHSVDLLDPPLLFCPLLLLNRLLHCRGGLRVQGVSARNICCVVGNTPLTWFDSSDAQAFAGSIRTIPPASVSETKSAVTASSSRFAAKWLQPCPLGSCNFFIMWAIVGLAGSLDRRWFSKSSSALLPCLVFVRGDSKPWYESPSKHFFSGQSPFSWWLGRGGKAGDCCFRLCGLWICDGTGLLSDNMD